MLYATPTTSGSLRRSALTISALLSLIMPLPTFTRLLATFSKHRVRSRTIPTRVPPPIAHPIVLLTLATGTLVSLMLWCDGDYY
jgi:hypothetical protein